MPRPKPFKITILKEEHRKKYIGDIDNIIARSKWERDFFETLISNPDVLKVASEEIVVPYYFKANKKWHRYYPDFFFAIRKNDGSIGKYIVEVKPYAQTQKPQPRGSHPSQKRKYNREMFVFMKNIAKWEACIQFCKKNKCEFLILTESKKQGTEYKLWDWRELLSEFLV